MLKPEIIGNLIGRIAREDIVPLVAETYGLRNIAGAQDASGAKVYIGKIVPDLT